MTIERARELLAEDAVDLTDEQIGELLKRLTILCSALLDIVLDNIVVSSSAPHVRHESENRSYLRPSQ